MQRSYPLGRLFGIEVRVHATWLVAFALITWSLASGYFRFQVRGESFLFYLGLGALSAVLLFGSVLRARVRALAGGPGARTARPQYHPVHLRRRLQHRR